MWIMNIRLENIEDVATEEVDHGVYVRVNE